MNSRYKDGMRLRTLLATAAALVALAPATSPAAATDSGLGIRLLDAPTALRNDPRARIYIIDHVVAGTVLTRHVGVSDNTDKPLSAALYVGGASIDNGSFFPSDRGTPSELGSWSTVTPSSASLQPRQSATAEVTIRVPKDAPDGERYGVIWAELPPAGGAVKTVNRVGIRIYLSVGNGPAPTSDFAVTQLQAQRTSDGIPSVIAQVRNTGQRALDMNGSLSLTHGPGGLSAGPFPATLGTTLGIGQTEPVKVVLPQAITGGPWTAKLTLQSDQINHAVTGTITFPAAGKTAPPVKAVPAKKEKGFAAFATIAGVLIGLLALGLFLLFWRRRRDKKDEPEAG
jgi:hypothetical protein